jgi:aryl-alcohol dehydrogenase-like predicted oxidoreductase
MGIMQRRTIGNGRLNLPCVGLGCMGMSEFYGPTDEAESIATIHRALELGVNFLDTADVYGKGANELLVGKAVAGRRAEFIIATKFGITRDLGPDPSARGVNGRPEYVRQCCDASLRRLNVGVIDLYYQHRVDPAVPIEETVGAMGDLVRAGKVRFIGLSEAGVQTIRRAHKIHPLTAIQSEYSLWTREPEDGVLDVCRELDIGFVAYSPLGRGLLTGQIRRFEDLAEDDWRRQSPRFQGDNFQRNLDLAEQIARLAAEKAYTPSQLALAWVLSRGANIVPIFGTKRRSYLEDNLKAVYIPLTPADLRRIEEVSPKGAVAGDRYAEAGMAMLGR